MAFFGGATAKSRSLDDIVAAVEGGEETQHAERGRKRPPALRETGRANTYEDRTATGAEAAAAAAMLAAAEEAELLMEFEPAEEEQFAEDDEDGPEDIERDQGLLREIRRSLKGMSTSLMQRRTSGGGGLSGSLTSVSSGRSLASNVSVQSDSGLRGQRGQRRQRGRKRPSAAAPTGRASAFTSKVGYPVRTGVLLDI